MNEGANFMDIPSNMNKINGIPLGKKNGIICFNKMVDVSNDAFEQKEGLRNRAMGVYRNEQKWKDIDAKEGKKFG